MWSCILNTLLSNGLETMNMKNLDEIYTLEDVPFPIIGGLESSKSNNQMVSNNRMDQYSGSNEITIDQ